MDDFQGSSKVKLDAKGRVTVPTNCRADLFSDEEPQAVLTLHLYEDCLVLYPMSKWREIRAGLDKLSNISRANARIKRRLLNFAQSVELDGSGRVATSPMLREKAKLTKEALFVGGGNCYEIWDEGVYNAEDEDLLETLRNDSERLAETLGDLNL